MESNRSHSVSSKPVWTLRSRAPDGSMLDHYETTRFKRRRTFDILNLSPGTYDLFVGIRRENFFFEDKQVGIIVKEESGSLGERTGSIDDEGSDDSQTAEAALEIEDPNRHVHASVTPTTSDRSVLRQLKAGLGVAFHGGRKVISTVTMGKVGLLAINLDVLALDSEGREIFATSEQLTCGDKTNFEARFTINDHESTVKLRIRSLSTLHSICVFASIFPILGESSEEPTPSPTEKTIAGSSTIPKVDATELLPLDLDCNKMGEMLKRALLGSRHPGRSAFTRALAFACFASWCGFTLGFMSETEASLYLAIATMVAWTARAIIHASVIALC